MKENPELQRTVSSSNQSNKGARVKQSHQGHNMTGAVDRRNRIVGENKK
jgi:hypothetical protein